MIFDKLSNLRLKKNKSLLEIPIEVMPPPSKIYIHFQQQKSSPLVPLVKTGDMVKVGTKIGELNGDIYFSVHSSISGKVIDIKLHPHPLFGEGLCCVIESDYSDTWEQKFIDADYHSLDKKEILERIKQAGITGLEGWGNDIKQQTGVEKNLKMLIINCCELEPNLAADYRLMCEYPVCITEGARIIQKVLNLPKLIFAIPRSYQKAGESLKKEGAEIKILPDSYPLSSESLLIKRMIKKNIPQDGLPLDCKIMVQNVSTCYAVFQAVKYRKPLIERMITVSGNGIRESKNLLVKIGTPVTDIIQYCGGLNGNLKKVIFGGMMTGIAQFSLYTPVIKAVNGIVFENTINDEESVDCVRCGKCIDVCPVDILPQVIYNCIKQSNFEGAVNYGLNRCIECGCCAYICPASISLLHYFKSAKLRIANG